MELGAKHLGRYFDVTHVKTMKQLKSIFTAGVLTFACAWANAQDMKVAYHVNSGIETAATMLGNVRNHLNADPSAKIVVVTHGPGIEFLLDGAKDSKGREFTGSVSELVGKGVQFRVCNNTLTLRNLDPSKVSMDAKIVPSGVSEIARLQAKEGFAYLKP
jgi:intracellular sulfur oxidation DsrE/DsrF family protein